MMRGVSKILNKSSQWRRNLNYIAYPNHTTTLKYFNDPKHAWLVEYGIGLNDLRKLQLIKSEVGRFKNLQQILERGILSEKQLNGLLDFVCSDFKNSQSTDLNKLCDTSSIKEIYSCVGIDFSPTELAFCSIDSYFNVTDMKYISLEISLSNLEHAAKVICDIVDNSLPSVDLYIIEQQPTSLKHIPKSTSFLSFYIMEQLLHAAIATRKNSNQKSQTIITMSEKEMCLHTGLPNMDTQREYICKVVTDDTFYYAEVIRSVNLMKLNEKRHVDLESMYDARNISCQYLVDVYFEILLKDNATLIEFQTFVNSFNIPDHLKLYYSSLPIKHDVADALWLAASYWFYMSKNHASFFEGLSPPSSITMDSSLNL